MDEATVLNLAEVLSSDVSSTMLRDAIAAAPQIGPFIHVLGCAHAGRVAVEVFRHSLETDEQRAMFERLLAVVLDAADTTVALAALRQEAAGLGGSGRG